MKRILYIDDNRSMTKLFQCLAEEYDFEAYVANDIKEGIRVAEKENPDVIITDIEMKDGGGLSFTAQLRSNKSTQHIPVIGCSVTYQDRWKELALVGGFKFVNDKPSSIEKLNKMLEELFPGEKFNKRPGPGSS